MVYSGVASLEGRAFVEPSLRAAVSRYCGVDAFQLLALPGMHVSWLSFFSKSCAFLSVHSHSLPIRFNLAPSRKLLHHSLDPVQ
jgi:hypothetical protein